MLTVCAVTTKALNRKLRTLIATMDEQTERILTEKEQHLEASLQPLSTHYHMADCLRHRAARHIIPDYPEGLARKGKDKETAGRDDRTE